MGPTQQAAAPSALMWALAITSLVFGVISIVGDLLMFLAGNAFYIGILAGIVGLVLGIVANVQRRSGVGITGLILSAVGIAGAIILLVIAILTRA